MGAGERGTRVELGVVGIGKRVRTRLSGRQESEEEGESERGKIRPTGVVVTTLGRGSVLCPPSKREEGSLVVGHAPSHKPLSRSLRVSRVYVRPCSPDCRPSCLRRSGSWETSRSWPSEVSQAESQSLRLPVHVISTPFHS